MFSFITLEVIKISCWNLQGMPGASFALFWSINYDVIAILTDFKNHNGFFNPLSQVIVEQAYSNFSLQSFYSPNIMQN